MTTKRTTMSHGDYGRRWGEGAARCLMIDGDFDEEEGVRLMPIPDCFICPMTAAVMEDPVMTVDGCTYERSFIERWFRQRQQERLRVTSPATNQELPSLRLVSLTALRKAIEAYLLHRPELRDAHLASRSFEEAAQMLYGDLLEKQAVHASAEDELSSLKESNEVLLKAVHDAERSSTILRCELEQSQLQARAFAESLQEERVANQTLRAKLHLLESSLRRHEAEMREGTSTSSAIPARCHASHSSPTTSEIRAVECHLEAQLSVHEVSNNKQCLLQSSCRKEDMRPAGVNLRGLLVCALMLIFVLVARDFRHREISAEVSSPCGLMVRNVSLPTEALTLESRIEQSKEDSRIKDDWFPKVGQSSFAIWNQVGHLRTGTPEEKTHAALVLGIAATTSPENQAAIVSAGAVPLLVELLQADAPEARGQAAVALRTLALGNAECKVVLEKAGAIPLLIKLLKDDSLEVQEVAAGALQALAEAKSQEVDINQESAIDSLTALLKDETPGVREEAAGALMILALNADGQVAMEVIPSLMELLTDGVPEVREQAAATLRNLAADAHMAGVNIPHLAASRL